MRKTIEKQTFDEERALYHTCHADILGCVFAGPADGESVLKESRDIALRDCAFSLRYPLWHVQGFSMAHSTMDEKTRAAIWYAHGGKIENCRLDGIKAVRECTDIEISDSRINSAEFGWKSAGITLRDTEITSEYIFFGSRDVRLEHVNMHGKYSFQYMENLEIVDSVLDTKDAFWHSRNVTVRNSVVKGEYLAWFSDGLTLINCKIIGTQPLCYCKNLRLVDCTMEATDLSFEYSDVVATVKGHVDSVKNPRSGSITLDSVGEVIMGDAVMPCTGKVYVRGEGNAPEAEPGKLTVYASSSYDILVQPGLMDRCGAEIAARFPRVRQIMLVTDDTVDALYGVWVRTALEKAGFAVDAFVFPHGEQSKTFDTAAALVERMAQRMLTRTDLVVALGGGVTGDLAGFAASVYLRGISFVQMPTTLLAAVDASVGGKTAVDISAGKNLAGAFHQPGLVLCDPRMLDTLPGAEFANGMAEVIKHSVLADPAMFARLASHDAHDGLDTLILQNLAIKCRYVAADEFDTGRRQLLNLGHTVGHAVEKLSGYSVSHGNAVAIGLVAICRAAYANGIAETDMADEVAALLQKYGLQTRCPFPVADVCRVIANDKKRTGGTISLAVPKQIGVCVRYQLEVERLEAFFRPAIG